jgi:hypothetical protein
MRVHRVVVTSLLLAVLAGCTSSGEHAAPSPVAPTTAASTTAAPTPVATLPTAPPSMSPEVIAACGHVRTAFEQQAAHDDWNKVVASLEAAWRAGHTAADRQLAGFLPAPGTVGVDDTQTLGEVTDTLTLACGLSTRAVPGTSLRAPNRRPVALSETAVDGVRMGTSSADAERLLRQSLGDAEEDVAICGTDSYRRLTWGLFAVLFDNNGRGVLHGWSLRAGMGPVFFQPPYDVQPGDAMSTVSKRVPGTVGEGPPDLYVVHTDRSPDLRWISRYKGAGGWVDEITFRSYDCD